MLVVRGSLRISGHGHAAVTLQSPDAAVRRLDRPLSIVAVSHTQLVTARAPLTAESAAGVLAPGYAGLPAAGA